MEQVSVHASFKQLPEHYDNAFRDAGRVLDIFSSLPWFENFEANVLSADEQLRVYGLESNRAGASPSIILPMRHSSVPDGARTLSAVANYYSPLFSPILLGDAPHAQQEFDLLARAIAGELPRWDIVDLHPVDTGSAAFKGLQEGFRRAGMMTGSYFCFGNWYLDVDGRSYQTYFNGLPSKLRNTIRRKAARLLNAGRLSIEIVTGEERLPAAMAAFEQVYASSWKQPEAYPEFIPGFARLCARNGWLRLGIAYIDETPAAAQLWTAKGDVASIYKLAYDERFSNESIGSILTARLMQHVIDEDRVNCVDFLSGDDAYKQDWMSHRRERHGIIAFNLRTVRGLLAAIRHQGGRASKMIAATRARLR